MPKRTKRNVKVPSFVTVIRWIVGLLFIFSGLIKANDPLGLSYKMQEFFDAWGCSSLNPLALPLAYLMNICEVLAGVAVIVGYSMPFFSWFLLLLMIAFAFLTGYATLSGKFKSCGCFGDCLPIPPLASFLKDVVLLLLILVLFFYRHRVQPLFRWKSISLVLLALSIVGVIVFQQFVLSHLPVRDCLPYRIGNNILQQMEQPKGSIPDSTVVTFKYKHKGKDIEFDADHFPADFDDATYQYVDRYDKVVRKGTAEPPIEDFVLNTLDGADTTLPVLSNPDKYVFVFIQNFDRWDLQKATFNSVLQAAKAQGDKVFLVSPNVKEAVNLVPSDVIKLTLDAVILKTAARVNATYFLMQGPVILDKKSYLDANKMIDKF